VDEERNLIIRTNCAARRIIYIVYISIDDISDINVDCATLIVSTKFFTTLHFKFKQRIILWTFVEIHYFTDLQLRAIIAPESLDFPM